MTWLLPTRLAALLLVAFSTLFVFACGEEEGPNFELADTIEAKGYINTDVAQFKPRELVVMFFDTATDLEIQNLLSSLQLEVISHYPATPLYGVRTPLGYSLEEMETQLEASPLVESAAPNYLGHLDSGFYGTYWLLDPDTDEILWWFNQEPNAPPLEKIVRALGKKKYVAPDGKPHVVLLSVEVLEDRIISLAGTVLLVDRGPEGVVVILEEADGAAWELLGPLADEIRSLAEASPGLALTVRGVEIFPSLTSRAGGLSLRVTAYQPGG